MLDQAGFPHISYSVRDTLKYAYRDDAGWHIEVIDADASTGTWSISLAVDTENRSHVSYDYTSIELDHSLRYATRFGTGWQTELVDSASFAGTESALSLDDYGYPHISHRDDLRSTLRYTWYDGNSWRQATVDTQPGTGLETSIAIAGSATPCISYGIGYPSRDLGYASLVDLQWEIQVVDSVGHVGRGSSLQFDSLDRPHISYRDDSNDAVKYCSWSGTEWYMEIVDAGVEVSSRTALALDSNDGVHIAYGCDNEFRYAERNESGWNTTTIDMYVDAGAYCSLALDSEDCPHLTYYDGFDTVLKYAYRDGDAWFVGIVGDGIRGAHNSLVVDCLSRPHVAYTQGGALWHTVLDNGDWHSELVDNNGSVGSYNALVVDNDGFPRISYRDASNMDLKYAAATGVAAVKRPEEVASSILLRVVGPCPSNGTVTLELYLPSPVNGSVSVSDLLGRRVCSLKKGFLTQGYHTLTWNGQGSRNGVVAGGVYLGCLDWEDGRAFTRFVLVR